MNLLGSFKSYSHQCPSGVRTPRIVRRGTYFRSSDQKTISRFQCRSCGKSFSEATFDLCFRQKKRQINVDLFRRLTAGYSQRRAALDLQVNRKTIVRKFLFLGGLASHVLYPLNRMRPASCEVEFDELITIEHTKLKPLSVHVAVERNTRWILGFTVSSMPAFGKLARISIEKYGPRLDERDQDRRAFLNRLKELTSSDVILRSDQNPHYVKIVQEIFPQSPHVRVKGKRGCVTGQGELKKTGHDPLFSLNHTLAMMRANINRLFRRTWCITKKKECLALHLALYAMNHNYRLI